MRGVSNALVVEPLLQGEIDAEGIIPRLREIEETRSSGILLFEGDSTGEVHLVLGQIASDQPERADGEDAVELLLALRNGRFEVHQRLPPLPVSRGDQRSRKGSLEVHVPADLMNYCERAGLTGLLSFASEDAKVDVVYDRGELAGIRLEGAEELNVIFGWEDGTFHVEATNAPLDLDVLPEEEVEEAPAPSAPSSAPPAAPPSIRPVARPDNTGQHFLRVVEVTLSDILREREERRPATRTSPPLPPLPKPRTHATFPPPRPKRPREDQTVRVIYLRPNPAAPVVESSTRHLRTDLTAEVALPPASPKRTSHLELETVNTTKTAAPEPTGSPLAVLGWVFIVLLLIAAALGVLAILPPLG